MKSRQIIFLVTVVFLSGAIAWSQLPHKMTINVPLAQRGDFHLISSVFSSEQMIPKKYTCDGENINPPLVIENIPTNAQSLALIVDDPDAPLGNFNHWVVWNIPVNTREIKANDKMFYSQQGLNSTGHNRYDGPCPPRLPSRLGQSEADGEAGPPTKHRYFFKLYALDAKIGLDGKAKKSDLEAAMQGHIINMTSLTGIYIRR